MLRQGDQNGSHDPVSPRRQDGLLLIATVVVVLRHRGDDGLLEQKGHRLLAPLQHPLDPFTCHTATFHRHHLLQSILQEDSSLLLFIRRRRLRRLRRQRRHRRRRRFRRHRRLWRRRYFLRDDNVVVNGDNVGHDDDDVDRGRRVFSTERGCP